MRYFPTKFVIFLVLMLVSSCTSVSIKDQEREEVIGFSNAILFSTDSCNKTIYSERQKDNCGAIERFRKLANRESCRIVLDTVEFPNYSTLRRMYTEDGELLYHSVTVRYVILCKELNSGDALEFEYVRRLGNLVISSAECLHYGYPVE